MRALIRYVAADAVRAQRWTGPLLAYLIAVGSLDAFGGGPVLPDYAATSVVLLPVALWLTIAVVNSEDPVQAAVTVVTAGGFGRVRAAKLVAAYLATLPLTAVAIVWPVALRSRLSPAWVGAGLAAHLICALGGVGLGALLCRPLVRRTGWAVLLGAVLSLAELLVPDAPPAHQLLVLLDATRPGPLASGLALIAAQTAALAALAVAAADRLARHRV